MLCFREHSTNSGLIFGLIFFAVILICVILYIKYKYAPVVLFAAFFLFGAWRVGHSLQNHTMPATAILCEETGEPTGEYETVNFTGIVLDTGFTAAGNQRAVIRGTHPHTGSRVRIMAYIQPHQPHVSLGQYVIVQGVLLPLTRAENPGGYDQFRHLRGQKIDATMWPQEIFLSSTAINASIITNAAYANTVNGGEADEIGATRRTLTVRLREVRDRLADVYAQVLPPHEAAVLQSMVLGDRTDMDSDLAELYRTMGIFHILSISGLHVTTLMLAANKLLGSFMKERRAAVIVLGVMIMYCLMTGAAVATVRAVTMGGVLVGGKIFGRDYDMLASIAAACVALLIYEPLFLFNIGVQASFGAVFGIGLLTAPIERLLSAMKFPKRSRAWLNFRKGFAVNIAASASTYIVFAYHFYEISLYGVLGNVVIMPTITLLLVLGAIVGLVGLVFLPAAELLAGAAYFILRFYEAAAVFFSGLPFALPNVGGGSIIVSALGVVVLLAFAKTMHEFDGERLRLHLASFGLCVAALCVALFLRHNPPSLQITPLYTRGEYMVLRHGSDTLVIGAPHGGEMTLLRYLNRHGTRRVSLILTTPPLPADASRLAEILPRVHTLYLPAHIEGVTASLMYYTLADLPTPENIIYLRDGDRRVIRGTGVQVNALPMGEFEVVLIE